MDIVNEALKLVPTPDVWVIVSMEPGILPKGGRDALVLRGNVLAMDTAATAST